ncbi:PKD domain-containing protein [Botryobacter ruber]|uniref:PKD domain-containing protein n=1 Tax=Botryobacter ruber TaxID=2171629 RepID=UPI000E0CB331|nr:PKD domain-containing protein [Botryobacter ruber]
MRSILPTPFYLLLTFLLIFLNKTIQAQTCTATISASNGTAICEGSTTTLKASPAFTALSYQWYKDGVAVPAATVSSLAVSEVGRYYVVVSGSACSDIRSNALTVTVSPTPTQPSVHVNPRGPICSGTPVTFTIINPDDAFYMWNFGDGSSLTGRETTVTHTYTVTGGGSSDYVVSVFAASANGCTSGARTTSVTVNQVPEIGFSETDNNFVYCLHDSVKADKISVVATIANMSSAASKEAIRTYFVDFSDGRGELPYQPNQFPVSNEAAPYQAIGNYPIRIRALTSGGCEVVKEYTYSVTRKPEANFSLMKSRAEEAQVPPCVPVIVTTTDNSSGGNLRYYWSVQPEQGWQLQSGTLQSSDPIFLFTEPGLYNVELIVQNSCGIDTTEQYVIIGWPQLQLPSGGLFYGSTTIDFSVGSWVGANAMYIDKNLGSNIAGSITITGPKSTTFRFNSDVFNFYFNFDVPGRYLVSAEVHNECGSSNNIYMGHTPLPVEVVILSQPTAASDDLAVSSLAELTILPNPGLGLFTVSGPVLQQTFEIVIANSVGKTVYSQSQSNFSGKAQLNLSHLPPDLYIVILRTAKQRKVVKLVLTK